MTNPLKPYSQACENNKGPILEVLLEAFAPCQSVLEVGSGTGQHAAFFTPRMPWLRWQTSDLPGNHAAIRNWLLDAPDNALAPLALDVRNRPWPQRGNFDALFSANSLHIMAWEAVEDVFAGAGEVLAARSIIAIYGPFNYGGRYTSDSNARFDRWLQAQDAASGIRDFEAVDSLAVAAGFQLQRDCDMPANNRLLVWRRG